MAEDAYVGRQFEGRYDILNLLGRGGMGAVYRAMDRSLQKEVAVKILREDFASRPDLRQYFLQEAELAAQLEHSGIVPVYHVNGDGNLLYIIMELIPGGNLASLMQTMQRKHQRIDLQEALQVVRQIALALQYAHEHNILHRDIKPANIMLRNRASAGLDYQPVVTDLGLAKVIDQNSSIQQPMMGTPNYMSPEQVLSQELDGRTDIYSLGLLLYELTVGRLPFQVRNVPEAIKYHVKEPIQLPRSLRPDLPKQVEDVILKAVAKDVNERFRTAAAFADSIDALGDLRITNPPDGTTSLAPIWQDSVINQAGRLFTPSGIHQSNIKGPSLQIRQPDGQFLFVPLKRRITIGRESDNNLVLEDTQASRHHAEILQQGNGYAIKDLGSTNGTYLNQDRLEKNKLYPIGSNDDLRIGNHRIRLLLGPSVPAEDERAFHATLISQSPIHCTAGQPVEIALQVNNAQEKPLHIDVTVSGLDNRWVRPFRPVDIGPRQEKRVPISLALPAEMPSSRNSYKLLLRLVDSVSGDEQSIEAQLHVHFAPVPVPLPSPPDTKNSPPAPTQKKSRLMPILVGVLLTVIVAGIGAVLFLNREPGASLLSQVSGSPEPPISVTETPTPAPTETVGNSGRVAVAPTHTPTATVTEPATNTPVPPTDTPAATNTATSTPVAPTATPTATNTATNTPVTPTHTPTATNTARPTGPTNTPTPLVMVAPTSITTPAGGRVSPTSTRVPPTKTPVPPPTRVVPTSPPAPPAPAGQIDGFESTQGWSSSNAAWGSLSASSEKVYSGNNAAKLVYNIPGADIQNKNQDYVVFSRNVPAGTPSQFTIWVYGDGSNHYLNLWVADSKGRKYQFGFGRIGGAEWRQMTANVNLNLGWPNQYLDNINDKTAPEGPLTVLGFVLDAHQNGQNVQGTIYLDDLRSN